MTPKATVLVTGAAGFIGSHLCDALLREGYGVRAADRVPIEEADNLEGHATLDYQAADLSSVETCNSLCVGVDAILHHAAMASVPASMDDPEGAHRDTATTTLALLAAAKKHRVRRFVFASTAAVYGDGKDGAVDENAPRRAKSPYAAAKIAGEEYVRAFAKMGLDAISLRYFNVYGPRQSASSAYAGVITHFMDALRKGSKLVVHGNGEQSRDFIHVNDAVRANLLALEHKDAFDGRAVNIASGKSVSVNALIETLAKVTGVMAKVTHEPARRGDIRHSLADLTLAEKLLGMKVETSLEEGLKELWEDTRTE